MLPYRGGLHDKSASTHEKAVCFDGSGGSGSRPIARAAFWQVPFRTLRRARRGRTRRRTAERESAWKVEPFPLRQVRLRKGPFRDALEADQRYLHLLPSDRLLHTFRLNAGLSSSAQPLGGWEKPDSEVRGHFTGGHYLSACALMYASAGDDELKDKMEGMVSQLADCQKAHQNGYLSAFPEEFFDRLREGRRVWAPLYTYHKIMAGLLDVHVHCGNDQALAVAEGMAEWVGHWQESISDEHMQRILQTEFGGLNEGLGNLYALTGKRQYLDLAGRFEKTMFLDPLAEHRDELKGIHANTHIPQVIGAARRYELTGEDRYREIAVIFLSHRHYRPNLLHRRHQQRRILANPSRKSIDGIGKNHRRVLLRLQHAQAGAPRLRMDGGPARAGLLRAHAFQQPVGHAKSRRWRDELLPAARFRILEIFQYSL